MEIYGIIRLELFLDRIMFVFCVPRFVGIYLTMYYIFKEVTNKVGSVGKDLSHNLSSIFVVIDFLI